MRTIIAGGRHYQLTGLDKNTLSALPISEVVCGGATGADEGGKQWAEENGIPVKMFPADWKKHGKAAGPIRNREMAEYAESLVAFWDGKSRGTGSMISIAEDLGLHVVVIRTDGGNR